MICGIDLIQELEAADLMIRQGQSQIALKRLLALRAPLRRSHTNPDLRPHLARLASLFRRTGSQVESLKLLKPLVRSEGRRRANPSSEEAAEYGVALVQIGATAEGESILSSIDFRLCERAQLFLAFAKVAQWNYEASIPLITRYLQSSSLTSYEVKIGQANLLSALVHEQRTTEAQNLAKDFLQATERDQNWLLHGVALQLMGELAISTRDWKDANAYLARAKKNLEAVTSNDQFFLEKWNLILRLKRHGTSPAILREFEAIKRQAVARGEWETLRDCDFHLALVTADRNLIAHLYHGSPFEHYRTRLLKSLQVEQIQIRAQDLSPYVWLPPQTLAAGSKTHVGFAQARASRASAGRPGIYDLTSAEPEFNPGFSPPNRGRDSEPAALRVGQVSHRLLLTLASDFYKPFWVPSLFAKVFPDRYYSSTSGPLVIRQSVFRLRQAMSELNLPIEISVHDGHYSLRGNGEFGLRVGSPTSGTASGDELQWRNLQRLLAAKPRFKSKDVVQVMGVSERKAQYWLKQGLESKRLLKENSGPHTCYSFRTPQIESGGANHQEKKTIVES